MVHGTLLPARVTPMDDIVSRLRHKSGGNRRGPRRDLRDQAAEEIERLREENRRLLTGDRVVYFPCKEHMGMPFTMTVGFAPPTMCKCPICEPPPSPLSAGESNG